MLARTLPLAVSTLLASLCSGPALRAQETEAPKPLPAGPDVLTQKRYQGDKARFWSGVLLAECKAGGALRAEWQPHVEELMTVYAELFCARLLGGDRGPRITRLCDRLRELGCDHPVVQLVSADALYHQRKPDAARETYAAAEKGIAARQSSAPVRYLLQNSLCGFYAFVQEAEPGRKAAAARGDCLVELAASPEFGSGKERYFLDLVLQSWSGKVGPDDLPALERMEKSAGKPTYALLVLRALHHNTLAWAARGQGPASSVSDADRKVFRANLDAAAKLLTQANEMCPQHPDAPTTMVKILGPGGAGPKELRRWLDRAVAAQFDWRDAYVSYLHYSQPRWGGSQRALLDLGLECLATARFDTEVPSLYRVAIHYVTLGTSDPKAVWADADVQEHLAELDQGCIAAAADDNEKRTATTHRIAALSLGAKAEEAAALSEQLGHRLDTKALEIYGVSEAWLTKTLRPHLKDYTPAAIAAGDVFAGFATARFPGMEKALALTAHGQAITSEQATARFAQWLGKTAVAAYERAGTHDAKWDTDARALLALFGDIVTGTRTAASIELATKLLDGGCKDPLTLYVVTRALDEGDVNRLARTLISALPDLEKSQSVAFTWWAKQHLSDLARRAGRPGIGSGLLPEMREHLLAAITDPMFAGDDRRHYVRCLWGHEELAKVGNEWTTDRIIASLATLQGADPWLVHVVTGLHNARKAKHGQASPNERAALVKLAAEHLGKAHELCPQFPEAAVGMIIVASLEQGAVSPREWFDRAVAAQIDYQPAYAAYVDTLRPRYGGSIQAMYRFAVECLDSARFDTDLPLWFARTMQRIQQEVRTPREAWASAGVAECLDRLFDGFEKQKRQSLDPACLHAGRCVLAWAGGRYGPALASWEAAGRKLDKRWLAVAGQEDADLIETDLRYLDTHRAKK
ncbi:MAG TPA: hypothetical protein VF384_02770 [Planctomycetota bacterium]